MATTFAADIEFLSQHTKLVVLGARRPALVAVAPAWQGRIMTSTPGGKTGPSLGWINRPFIAGGQRGLVFDNYGGEDRFWLGPEAGQFGLWFQPGEPFDLAHWKTQAGLNTGEFAVTSQGPASIALAARFDVTNASGTTFQVAVKRVIDVLPRDEMAAHLGASVPRGVSPVAFSSTNELANVGPTVWSRETGLLSVWTLGQFNPLPRGLVIVPFLEGADSGPMPTGEYFGKVPAERYFVRDGHIFFRCDGAFRSKLGVPPGRAKRVLGSYDPDAQMLTIVQFNLPSAAGKLPYVNSQWERQRQPFVGDVVNSYNDGAAKSGPSPAAFYELETSSPAAELAPEESVTHVHRTYHFSGDPGKLNTLARKVLGVDLNDVHWPG